MKYMENMSTNDMPNLELGYVLPAIGVFRRK
jgi:hypothetical protein